VGHILQARQSGRERQHEPAVPGLVEVRPAIAAAGGAGVPEPPDPAQGAEIMVERPVLLDEDDHMADVPQASRSGRSGTGAGGLAVYLARIAMNPSKPGFGLEIP
jgi:hypothetical protein